MDIQKILSQKPAWESDFYSAYRFDGEPRRTQTVLHYQIPFSPEKEAVVFAKYSIPQTERKDFYRKLLLAVQRQLAVTQFLMKMQVPSILYFSQVFQEQQDGVSHIFLVTDNITPVIDALFSPSLPIVTAMEAFQRISCIMRDIAKVGVTHRGFTLNETFLTEDSKILLGGFYYASCPGVEKSGGYLPNRPRNLPGILVAGDAGSHASDIQCLAMTAWNMFSGAAHDAPFLAHRLIQPMYATPEIASALLLGLHITDENCNAFRRRLSDARKAVPKSSSVRIPCRVLAELNYKVTFVPIPASADEDIPKENTTTREEA